MCAVASRQKHSGLRDELAVGRHALDAGHVLAVCEQIRNAPRKLNRLIELLWDDEPGVASRAADVLERVTCNPSPALRRIFDQHKGALLGLLPDARFSKLRWNLALLIGRLPLAPGEARRAAASLYIYLDDGSSIVKTAALQGLADLTRADPESTPAVLDLLRIQGRSGTPAMRARSRILLKRFEVLERRARAAETHPPD
jgi:hypothetical protein